MLRIRAIGAVAASIDGVDLDLGGPRQRAVLGLLAAAGPRVVSTDRFLEDLWDGGPPPRALGALQVYVSNLRKALEPERRPRQPSTVLVSATPGYRLDLPDDAVDTWRFTSMVRTARAMGDPGELVERLDDALALWSGEPFAAYAGHEWADVERTRLRELRADAVQLRASAALDLGRTGEVVETMEAHVHAHPLREEGVRLLALGLYRLQRQSDALGVLAAARTRLVDELGVDPSPELRDLEVAILNHAPHLRAPVAPAVTAPPPAPRETSPQEPSGEDSVVGRESELERLRAAASSASGPSVAWVGGEAGIGKTTLVDRFCDESVAAWTIARGHCPEVDGAPPGWAWWEVLGALRGSEVEPAEAMSSTPFELAHRVGAAIAEASHDVLLVLDDLHRADGETLQLLRHVLTSVSRRVLLLGTYRPEDASQDLQMTFAAAAERTVERLDLTGLPAEQARTLVAEHSDVELSESVHQQLLERSGGNPLFLKQVARLAASEGPDIAVNGLPSAIHEILGRRLDRLPAATVDLLSRAALLGRDVDVDVLVTLERERGTATEDEVIDALDAGLVAGLVVAPRPESLTFSHALVRDALYDRLPPMRRTRLHGAAMDLLERDRPDDVLALARHAAQALDTRRAPRAADLLTRAAEELLRIGSHVEAARLVRQALEAHELAQTPPREQLSAHRALVHALATTGDLRAAHLARAESIRLAIEHGTPDDARRALLWSAPTAWTIRELHAVDEVLVARLRQALEELGGDPAPDEELRVRLLATLSLETEGSPWSDLAVDAATEAVERARALGDPALSCIALNAAYLTAYPPRPDGTLRSVGEELLAAARAAGLLHYEAIAHYALFGAAAGDTDLETARRHTALAVRSGTAGQLPLLLVVAGIFAGLTSLVEGRLDEADAIYGQVTRQLAASGDPNGIMMQLVLEFAVAHARGDTGALVERFLAVDQQSPANNHDYVVCTLLDAGQVDRARERWSPGPVKQDYFWLFNACLRLQNAARLGADDVVVEMIERLEPWRGRFAGLIAGTASLGPVDLFLGLGAAAVGDRTSATQHLREARRLAAEQGATHWVEQADRVSPT